MATTPEPQSVFTAIAAVTFLAAGIELGIAFLMRATREAVE